MILRNLINLIHYDELINAEDIIDNEILGVSYNSKTTQKGDAFVCLTGEHVDGHEYAEEAVNNGAAICVVERQLSSYIPQIIVSDTSEVIAQISSIVYGNPSEKLNMIGVTGTNGKTTVSHLIQKIFESNNQDCALIGTLGCKFSSKDSYFDTKHTTPQAPDLQRTLELINERNIPNVAMEVSSHALAQHRVDYCEFNCAVFTNLTQDHLDYHITMKNYFRAKSLLFEKLMSDDKAVINIDDNYGKDFIDSVSKNVRVITYGIKNHADIMAKDIKFDNNGASFTCIVKDKEYAVNLMMNGMFSVYNVLAAIAVAYAYNLNINTSIKTLESIRGVAGRFEIVTNKPTVIVDYAHTPDGLENILEAAREITPDNANLICLFGCGGDRDTTKRPKMGEIAERLSDKVIVTSDNPRSEDPQQIITDILAGFKTVSNVIVEPDRELAIKEAYRLADVNDVVVVAGKGHEDYQILKDKTIHFDDREIVRKVFLGAE